MWQRAASSVTGPGGDTGYVAKGANNNVYAGKDGNVYKQNSSGGWSKYDNGQWNQVQRPNTAQRSQSSGRLGGTKPSSQSSGAGEGLSSDTYQQLNNDAAARRQGNTRTQERSRSGGRQR